MLFPGGSPREDGESAGMWDAQCIPVTSCWELTKMGKERNMSPAHH